MKKSKTKGCLQGAVGSNAYENSAYEEDHFEGIDESFDKSIKPESKTEEYDLQGAVGGDAYENSAYEEDYFEGINELGLKSLPTDEEEVKKKTETEVIDHKKDFYDDGTNLPINEALVLLKIISKNINEFHSFEKKLVGYRKKLLQPINYLEEVLIESSSDDYLIEEVLRGPRYGKEYVENAIQIAKDSFIEIGENHNEDESLNSFFIRGVQVQELEQILKELNPCMFSLKKSQVEELKKSNPHMFPLEGSQVKENPINLNKGGFVDCEKNKEDEEKVVSLSIVSNIFNKSGFFDCEKNKEDEEIITLLRVANDILIRMSKSSQEFLVKINFLRLRVRELDGYSGQHERKDEALDKIKILELQQGIEKVSEGLKSIGRIEVKLLDKINSFSARFDARSSSTLLTDGGEEDKTKHSAEAYYQTEEFAILEAKKPEEYRVCGIDANRFNELTFDPSKEKAKEGIRLDLFDEEIKFNPSKEGVRLDLSDEEIKHKTNITGDSHGKYGWDLILLEVQHPSLPTEYDILAAGLMNQVVVPISTKNIDIKGYFSVLNVLKERKKRLELKLFPDHQTGNKSSNSIYLP